MEKPPTLLVVTGPPGAGKSTVARLLADRFEPSVLVEGDAFFRFLARGAIEPWRPESDAQNDVVTRAAASAAGGFARGGFVTVYDGVVGPWFLDTFASASGLDRLEYVMLLPSVDTCVERVATRVDHEFSDEPATRTMHEGFAGATIAARHVLVDPPATPDAVADAVLARYEAGSLTYRIAG
ncbi:MAG TPA: AAA family ATPase [Acidimicrobiia bacterium]|nr:AAA family ATPase [Acidimicrobiia bacterium]